MALNNIGDNIWTLEGNIVKMLSIPFSTRMTIVRLSDDSLWVHSPVSINRTRINQISSLGKVKHIIAPNKFHHLSLGDWSKEFPDAKIWAAPGLEKKRIDLKFWGILQDSVDPFWENDIKQAYFQGSKVFTEVVFFHELSKTLILTDIIQNHDSTKDNLFWRIIKSLNGVSAPNGGVPRDLKLSIRNKNLAKQSLHKILAWDFDRIIISHGICIENDAKNWLFSAFAWLL